MNKAIERKVIELIEGRATSDGDGVKLLRVFGGQQPERFDPFLLLDEFGSEEASDYIGGFPQHPHRGFETVTYMLEGKMEHRDHMGNVGLLSDGDVQWMTAGKGVIHSEMPQQTQGKMRGFQLWLNLPASKKMQPARYEDVSAAKIPVYKLEGAQIKAIAGQVAIQDQKIEGYFTVPDTKVLYLDIHLQAESSIEIPIDQALNTLLYLYNGELKVNNNVEVSAQHLARFSEGDRVLFSNLTKSTANFLLLAGKPIQETIVQHGPFVMNTVEQINQAVQDYRNGVLTD